MTETDWLADRFEEHRPRLRGVAYRMLVIALRESYERVTDGSARTTPGAIARSLETVVESRGLLAQVRAKHPADGLPADGLAADGLGPASTY